MSLMHFCFPVKFQDAEIIVVNKPPGMPVQVSCQYPSSFYWIVRVNILITTNGSLDRVELA